MDFKFNIGDRVAFYHGGWEKPLHEGYILNRRITEGKFKWYIVNFNEGRHYAESELTLMGPPKTIGIGPEDKPDTGSL